MRAPVRHGIVAIMTSRRRTLRVTVPVGLSALMLAVAGSLSTASAETWWSYSNERTGACITSSTVSDKVWGGACNDALDTRNWAWGSETYTNVFGVNRRFVSRANGECLTTDDKTDTNTVWTSPCGSAGGQWWNGDDRMFQNANGNYLRTSSNGDALYTSPYSVVEDYGIEPSRFTWWGQHD